LTSRDEVERAALELSPAERLEVAAALYESIEPTAEQPRLPEWQRNVLDEGIAEDDAGSDPGEPWEDVKRQILANL
jgi:putative addiction module component (TIGR02574 family)